MAGPRTSRADWVMRRARRDLEARLDSRPTLPQRLQLSAIAPGWKRLLCLGMAYVTLLLLAVPLKHANFELWPSFASRDAGQILGTLWQVQAGLVSLGFPLLLLLIQFSRDEGVTALRSSEVLARETFVRVAMELSTLGLLAAGALAAWLASDGAVVGAMILITIPTALALLRSYLVALELHFDRDLLRRKSSDLLQAKLRSSMRELWEIQRANSILLEGLAPLGVVRSYLEPEPSDPRWWSVTAPMPGRIVDINLDELRTLLEELPQAGPNASADLDDPTPSAPSAAPAPAPIQLLRFCGDHVEAGERVMVLLRDGFALGADPALRLDRVLRIQPDER